MLGPILFLVFMNDIVDDISPIKIRLFADDCVIFNRITCSDDQVRLNGALEKIQAWSDFNGMELNINKTCYMQFSNKQLVENFEYSLGNMRLIRVRQLKYLGVILSEDLGFNKHIASIVAKASKILFYLHRRLKDSCPEMRKLCYITYVRPILEYAGPLWSPSSLKQITALENIQRRDAHFVFRDFRKLSSPSAMIDKIGWPSLQKRRALADLKLFYQIYYKQVGIDRDAIYREFHAH